MKNKLNLRVVIYSMIGIICVILTFFVDWIFILGAIIMIWLNQRELIGKH